MGIRQVSLQRSVAWGRSDAKRLDRKHYVRVPLCSERGNAASSLRYNVSHRSVDTVFVGLNLRNFNGTLYVGPRDWSSVSVSLIPGSQKLQMQHVSTGTLRNEWQAAVFTRGECDPQAWFATPSFHGVQSPFELAICQEFSFYSIGS